MQRTRWELYDSIGNLEAISSVLTILRVERLTWDLTGYHVDTGNPSQADKFIVSNIFLGEAFWDNVGSEGNLEIVLAGVGRSKLRIEVEDGFSFRLTDLPEKMQRYQ